MANAYNNQYTTDSSYGGGNPYDPDTDPQLFQQWQFEHQSGTIGAGAPFNGGRLAEILALTAAGGAAADYFGAAGGAAGAGSSGGGAAAAPAALSSSVPTVGGLGAGGTLAGGYALPGAATLGAAPAAVAGGGAAAGGAAAGGAGGSAQGAAAGAAKSGFWTKYLEDNGVKLATTFASGLIQRGAINSARDALTQAGDKAIATQQQQAGNAYRNLNNVGAQQRAIYNQQISNLDPYTSLGGGAANTLGGLLGIPITMPQRQQIPNDLPPPSLVPPGRPMGPMPGGIGGPNVPGQTPFSGAGPQRPQPFGQPQPQGQTVKMKAPDGSMEDVPAQLVPHYQSLGASVVQS